MAHGNDADIEKVVRIASAAQQGCRSLDDDRSKLYVDLIHSYISEAARRALRAVDMSKYEYQSDFAKKWVAEGKAIGRASGLEEGRAEGLAQGLIEGRADLIERLLTVRFGALNEDVRARIAGCSLEHDQ